jgi:LPS sulfotransferase NodH
VPGLARPDHRPALLFESLSTGVAGEAQEFFRYPRCVRPPVQECEQRDPTGLSHPNITDRVEQVIDLLDFGK